MIENTVQEGNKSAKWNTNERYWRTGCDREDAAADGEEEEADDSTKTVFGRSTKEKAKWLQETIKNRVANMNQNRKKRG